MTIGEYIEYLRHELGRADMADERRAVPVVEWAELLLELAARRRASLHLVPAEASLRILIGDAELPPASWAGSACSRFFVLAGLEKGDDARARPQQVTREIDLGGRAMRLTARTVPIRRWKEEIHLELQADAPLDELVEELRRMSTAFVDEMTREHSIANADALTALAVYTVAAPLLERLPERSARRRLMQGLLGADAPAVRAMTRTIESFARADRAGDPELPVLPIWETIQDAFALGWPSAHRLDAARVKLAMSAREIAASSQLGGEVHDAKVVAVDQLVAAILGEPVSGTDS